MRKNKSANTLNNQTSLATTSTNLDDSITTNTNENNTNVNNNNLASNNLVESQESKIRNLLKDLQTIIKSCQDVRALNKQNINTINKTHENFKKESKITQSHRKKLQSLYTKGLDETDKEIKSIKKALDCIKDIRSLQSELHVIKNSVQFNGKEKPKIWMRRGVLMSILQQASLTLPLWVGEIGSSPQPLCGCIPQSDDYICKIGDKVAARVKNQEDEENWILAETVSYNQNNETYEVDDIDAEDGQERHTVDKDSIVPLPLWRANPLTDQEAIFPKDSIVLALYPQTTCFYRGVVSEPPRTPQDDYLIMFEDSSYLEGYSPPLNVPQLYVVAYKDIN